MGPVIQLLCASPLAQSSSTLYPLPLRSLGMKTANSGAGGVLRRGQGSPVWTPSSKLLSTVDLRLAALSASCPHCCPLTSHLQHPWAWCFLLRTSAQAVPSSWNTFSLRTRSGPLFLQHPFPASHAHPRREQLLALGTQCELKRCPCTVITCDANFRGSGVRGVPESSLLFLQFCCKSEITSEARSS